jgi:hypothetical protein
MLDTPKDREGDAAVVGAVNRMARSVARQSNQFDYRDIAQDALLYVLARDFDSEEHREANAILKCRGVFLDRTRGHAACRTVAATAEQLVMLEERRPYVEPPFGLWPQELRIYAQQAYRDHLANPLKRGRGRPREI